MFKIQDGRKSFTQWDLNRKIIVEDDSITQVHFTNLLNKNALVSEVKNHLADVPNVLLQDYGTILIYGYDGNYTKYVEAFRVVRREKPEDYIYTETEVLNYNNLLERMNNIEGSIQQVVTDYLRENPPKVDLEGYATKEYVDNAIAAISAVDLSDYFTKEEANAKFATKEEIPSTAGLATETFVNEAVAAIEIPEVDLSGYQEKLTAGDNITIEGNVISATGGSGGGSVAVDGTTIIQNDDGTISTAFGKGYMYVDSDSLIRADNTLNATPDKSIIFGSGNSIYSSAWGRLYNSVVIGNNNFFNGGSMASNSIYLGNNNTVMNVGGILAGNNCLMSVGIGNYNSTPCIMVGTNLQSGQNNPYAMFGRNGNLQSGQMLAVAYGDSASDAPIFSVDTSGNVNANGTISGSGSDYAEYFEWQDGNPEGEDRVGLIVALRGDKIVLAQDGDDVLGIVSGTATVLGDNAEYTWSKIHLRDDFGRLIYEDVVFKNEDGTTYTEKHPKINPAYNPEEDYIARSKRKEWDVVGMLGKLYVRDDGTCGVGGYAKVGADGIATLSQEPTNMYVMKRTAANIVRVLFK